MKKILIALIFTSCFFNAAFSQRKHDYVWTIGYGAIFHHPMGFTFGGIIMDFNVSPPSLTIQDYVIDRPKATISDKNGRLVAYTDGCRILNRAHQIMQQGDTLNPGATFNEFCGVTSYPLWQPTIFLPKPGSDSLYYLFHLRCDDVLWNPINLMYSVIDASGNGGDGAVISKNNSILSDSIYLGNYVTATRHANGRDWWVVTPRRYSNGIHVSLLSPEGVEYKGMQDVFSKIDSAFWGSQTAFSPDGSKYFRNSYDGLLMLDFDRCTGMLSNPVYLDWDSIPFGGGGVAVSPNSRFLYLSSGGTVQQYDLWATDLAASMQEVAVYDGTVAPFAANFFQMMPGPDGKIYIITSHDNDVLHVINYPNEPGLGCDVVQHAIHLPALSSYFIPNFANYNLGPLLGSPCDTLGIVGVQVPSSTAPVLQVSPNPAIDVTSVSLPNSFGGVLSVYNTNGQKLKTVSVLAGSLKTFLDFGSSPAGLYWVVFTDVEGTVAGTVKVSLTH